MKKRVRITRDREVNTYYEMWQISYWTLFQAQKETEGSYYQLMSSLIFTAFTIEAYLNHIGENLFSCWKELERSLSPQSKIGLICEKLGISKDDGRRPFQTLKKLFVFRNEVAHGKTKEIHIIEEKMIDAEMNEDSIHARPDTEWEQYCTISNVIRARDDVEDIMKQLHAAMDESDDPLLILNSWSTGIQILPKEPNT